MTDPKKPSTPENFDFPNFTITRMLELADYTPFLTEIGRLVYYWADFEFLFDKILYEIWKLEWAEPQPTHLKIGFNIRCDYWRMLAERRLANDPARKSRLLKLIDRARSLRRTRDIIVHGGPFHDSSGMHWYVVEYGGKVKLSGEPMSLSDLKGLCAEIDELHKELMRLDSGILRFPVTWLDKQNKPSHPQRVYRRRPKRKTP